MNSLSKQSGGDATPQSDEPLARKSSNLRSVTLIIAALLVVAGSVTAWLAFHPDSTPPPAAPPAIIAPVTSSGPGTSGTGTATRSPIRAPSSPPVFGPAPTRSGAPAVESTPAPAAGMLTHSVPVSLDIPAIGVHSDLLALGLNADRSVEVPPLDTPDSQAGWYRYSPTPGELGPAIILGHVDSAAYGPGVFYRLGALRPGDLVRITRADGKVAIFRVDRNVRYPKNSFPTDEVYGNIDHPGLRLITCGGRFDPEAGSYQDNDIVFASLVHVDQAAGRG